MSLRDINRWLQIKINRSIGCSGSQEISLIILTNHHHNVCDLYICISHGCGVIHRKGHRTTRLKNIAATICRNEIGQDITDNIILQRSHLGGICGNKLIIKHGIGVNQCLPACSLINRSSMRFKNLNRFRNIIRISNFRSIHTGSKIIFIIPTCCSYSIGMNSECVLDRHGSCQCVNPSFTFLQKIIAIITTHINRNTIRV